MKNILFSLILFFLLISITKSNLIGNENIIKNPNARIPKYTPIYKEIDDISLYLDIYYPKQKKDTYSLIIWVHGGGWSHGSKVPPGHIDMTKYGYAVASIDYRLSPQAKFPAQIDDVKSAVRWLRLNSKKYKFNPERFGVWGHSAGGHLSALLGTSCSGEDVVQAVCDLAGPTDFSKVKVSLKEDGPFHEYGLATRNLIGGNISDNLEKVKAANPITYVNISNPPFLIIHGDKDDIVPYSQAELLHEALQKKGAKSELIIVKNAGHGFDFDGNESFLKETVVNFFNKYLK